MKVGRQTYKKFNHLCEIIQGSIPFAIIRVKFLYHSLKHSVLPCSFYTLISSSEKGKYLNIRGKCIIFLIYFSSRQNYAHMHDFHCLFISFRDEVSLVSPGRSQWSSLRGRVCVFSNNNDRQLGLAPQCKGHYLFHLQYLAIKIALS